MSKFNVGVSCGLKHSRAIREAEGAIERRRSVREYIEAHPGCTWEDMQAGMSLTDRQIDQAFSVGVYGVSRRRLPGEKVVRYYPAEKATG